MSRTRRNFSAKFKTDLVLEVLKGEKELNVIATENQIQPNLLRNWKKEFLEKASIVFDENREENLKEKLEEERKEKSEYAKKVGQTHHAGGLAEKKNLRKCLDLTTRVNLVRSLSRNNDHEIPVSVAAELAGINRTSIYYKGSPVSEMELKCKEIIDHLHTDHPTWGARQMSSQPEGTRLPHRKEKSQTLDERDGHRSDLSKAQSFKMPSEGGRRTLSSPEHGDRPSQRGVVDRHHLYPDEARLPVSYSHHRLVQQMYRRMGA